MAAYEWTMLPANLTPTTPQDVTRDDTAGALHVRGSVNYQLRNQSNETVNITCYTVRVRNNFKLDSTQSSNIYTILGDGFAQNGYDPADRSATNDGLQYDTFNPFNSRTFCKTFKITRTRKLTMKAGGRFQYTLRNKWRLYYPNDLVLNDTASTAWPSLTHRYDYIKGEQFILFQLHGSVAGIAAQATLEKNITHTTPTVIMRTYFQYQHKHFHQPSYPINNFVISGHSDTTGVIMLDDDYKAGAEADAS